jgi:hypothetical protein
MSRTRALIIIPALNEELSLPATLDELFREASGHDLLVVDDGSTDGTARVARERGVSVVRHAINLGVGGALQTGFRYAIERDYQAGVQFDADGQHDPRYLDALLAPLFNGECDVAIGSRFVATSSYRAPRFRRIGMVLFSAVVELALGQRIWDTTSGFRAYSRSVMEICQHDFPQDFPDAPLLIALGRRGFRLQEVPVEMRERQEGRSFYTLGKSLYYPYKNLLASLMAWLQRPV